MRTLLLALVALGAGAGAARSEGPDLEQVFRATANAPAPRYRLGRDVLFAAGDAAVAVARAHEKSPDPHVRSLAALLRLRHEHPELFAVWQDALRAPWIKVTATQTEPPGATVRFPRQGAKGQVLEYREVLFWPASVPVVHDALRAPRWDHAARIAGAMRSADSVPFLVACLAREWDPRKTRPLEDALVSIGPAAAPALRDAVSGPKPVAAVARALGRIGDKDSAAALLKVLAATNETRTLEAVTAALGRIAPDRAATVLLGRLLDAASIRRPRPGGLATYGDLRGALVSLCPAAKRVVAAQPESDDPVRAAILGGLAWELARSAPKRKEKVRARFVAPWRAVSEPRPLPLLAEHAAAFGAPQDLARLLDVDPERGIPLAKLALLGRLRRSGGATVFAALTDRSVPDAIGVAERILNDRPPHQIERHVEALLLALDEPRALAVLRGVVERGKHPRYAPAVPIARAALDAARTEQPLRALLKSEQPAVALAGARALARRKDPSGVPLLVKAALVARGYEYAALRRDIVRAGVVPRAAERDDLFHRVLREAVRFRIGNVERARTIDVEIADPNPGRPMRRGGDPIPGQTAGLYLGRKLGKTARPLLEEAALFGEDPGAAQALGFLGLEESIPVLVRIARRAPFAAAHALRNVGPKGLAAAKKIPMPDPRRADYRGRAYRHVAAADALTGKAGGVEKALKGLAEAPPKEDRDAWARRMAAYITMGLRAGGDAGPDARFLEPVLRLATEYGDAFPALRYPALELLGWFRDERIANIAVRWLPVRLYDHEGRIAATTLHRTLDGDVIAFLRKRLQAAPNAGLRHTLWRYVRREGATRDDRDHCARLLREACRAGDERAADELLVLHHERPENERDARDLAAVLEFIRARAKPGPVTQTIPKYNPPGAGEALLASYRLGRHHSALSALGAIGYEPAAADVHAEWKRVVAGKKRSQFASEIRALARMGATGRRLTAEYLKPEYAVAIRLSAAGALQPLRASEAVPPLLALWDELEAAATDEARKQHSRAVWLAAELDPNRAHAAALKRAFRGPARLRDLYAGVAQTLRDKHPELAK